MTTPAVRQRQALLVVCTIAAWFLVVACSQQEVHRDNVPESICSARLRATENPEDLPDFLSWIHPLPGSIAPQKDFLSTDRCWAVLGKDRLFGSRGYIAKQELSERIELLIDGEHKDVEFYNPGENNLLSVCGGFHLSVGQHEAVIRVRDTQDRWLEYRWEFMVVSDEPRVSGLPWGFQFVRPLPGSTVTLDEYEQEQLLADYCNLLHRDLRESICIGVFYEKIDPLGTFWPANDRYSLVEIDNHPPPTKPRCQTDGVHHYQCWRLELGPGMHEATAQLLSPSGMEVDYTWQFTITVE